MTDVLAKADKLAQSAVLTLTARAAISVVALLFVPAVVALFGMSASIERLTAANVQLKTELGARIDQAEARTDQRLLPLESRQNTHSDRLRGQDARIDALTEKVTQITVQVAVLVERINVLIASGQPPLPARPGPSPR